MALNGSSVFEVRTGGNDTNGGGFATGSSGTDWSQQDAPQYAVTDAVTNGTVTVTSASANFGTDVVGNVVYVAGGSGSVAAGWYAITSRPSTTSITLDRSIAASTGATLNIGGALATLGGVGAVHASSTLVAGTRVFIKYSATPYDSTANTQNVSGGTVNITGSITFQGYDTTRTLYNSDANKPTLRVGAGVTSCTFFSGANYSYIGLVLDGNGQTGSRGAVIGTAIGCKFQNFLSGGMTGGNAYACEFTLCSSVGACAAGAFWCYAHDNTAAGFLANSFYCISANNTGAATDGFTLSPGNNVIGCVAYGNGRDGFRTNSTNFTQMINCVSVNNGGFGYSRASTGLITVHNSADFNNTGGRLSTTSTSFPDVFPVTLTGDPLTNAAGGNFAPNNVAGAGALLRALAFPAFLPGFPATLDFADIGAAQH